LVDLFKRRFYFRIVSDTTMSWDGQGHALAGGFQEQLTLLSTVPEPRSIALVLASFFAAFVVFRRGTIC
jgi:hypothetical protein